MLTCSMSSSNIGVSIAKADKASFAQMVRPHKFKAIAFLFTQLEKGNYRQKTSVPTAVAPSASLGSSTEASYDSA